MRITIREVHPKSKFCEQITLETLHRVIPPETLHHVLTEGGVVTPRVRKLSLPGVALWVIALNLFRDHSTEEVYEAMAGGLDLLWTEGEEIKEDPLPGASALSYRRKQLGARPMAALFRRICRPLATPQTKGAFRFGLRLMALDGSTESVPDTPQNGSAFGGPSNQHGSGAYPQVRGIYLCECGTHALVDACFWPYARAEQEGAHRLLRSVGPGMLVTGDRGVHSFSLLWGVRERGAHALFRLPASVAFTRIRTLPDGSVLAWLSQGVSRGERGKALRGRSLLVRVVEYTFSDPALPGYGEVHRLVTTLLDPEQAPALELACAYHERWEIEGVIDEKDTHLRLADRPLRSRTPVGVIQELYGALLAHYAIRFLMHEAAVREGVDPDRLSFTHTLRVVRQAVLSEGWIDPLHQPQLYGRLLTKIARGKLPPRRCRSNPRVVKRQQSKFPVKRPEHRSPPKPACDTFDEAVVLI
jgi:hypothetical protein